MGFNVTDGQGNQALYENRREKRADGWGVVDRSSGSCEVIINTGDLGTGTDTLTVRSGTALLAGETTAIPEQTISIPEGASEPRKDVIMLDDTGSVTRSAGYAEALYPTGSTLEKAERPAPPALDGAAVAVLAIILVPAGASTITSDEIIDIRSRANYETGSLTGDVAALAERIGIPQYADDADAPTDALYFNTTGAVVKYKDSSGTIHSAAADGASALSELAIDASKDWQGYDISNTGTVSGDGATLASRLGIPVYSDDANAPADSLYFFSPDNIIKYKEADGTVHGGIGSLSELAIDTNKDWQGYDISNLGILSASTAEVADGLGIPTYTDETAAPTESLFFDPSTTAIKYKDADSNVYPAVTALSDLNIDTDKDWGGQNISNLGVVSGSASDFRNRLGLPEYDSDSAPPTDTLYFHTSETTIKYKDSSGNLHGILGGLSGLSIDVDKDWKGYSISNVDELETAFTTHSNTLDSDYTVSAGQGAVVAGELTGTGSITGDGSLAVIDEGIHNDVRNPMEADVDAAGYAFSNLGGIETDGVHVNTTTPGVRLNGTETNAEDLTIRENAGAIELYDESAGAVAGSWNLNPDLAIGNTTHTAADHESGGSLEVTHNNLALNSDDHHTRPVAGTLLDEDGSNNFNVTHTAADHEAGGSLEMTLGNIASMDPPAVLVNTATNRPAAGTADRVFVETDTGTVYRDTGSAWDVVGTTNIADTDHSAADHESGGSLELTHNNLSLTASDHHTPSSSTRNLQPEGMQTGLAADATGVQYSGEMYQYIDGALLADGRAVYLEAATNSSAGDEDVTVEVYDPAGAAVLDSLVITGGSTRTRSGDISASLTADSEVQVRWNVTTASGTGGATFDAVAARLVVV